MGGCFCPLRRTQQTHLRRLQRGNVDDVVLAYHLIMREWARVTGISEGGTFQIIEELRTALTAEQVAAPGFGVVPALVGLVVHGVADVVIPDQFKPLRVGHHLNRTHTID